jgi:hypothetical protein
MMEVVGDKGAQGYLLRSFALCLSIHGMLSHKAEIA